MAYGAVGAEIGPARIELLTAVDVYLIETLSEQHVIHSMSSDRDDRNGILTTHTRRGCVHSMTRMHGLPSGFETKLLSTGGVELVGLETLGLVRVGVHVDGKDADQARGRPTGYESTRLTE
jgi:hypothetical protein